MAAETANITTQDLDAIIQRLGALEAQLNRPKIGSDNAKITGEDNRANIGFRDKVRRKPTKSASFNERSTSKPRRRSPYRHTVPSDKDETTRIEEFRTECISKSLKCNTVDIVSSYTRKENPVIFLLPSWLSENDIKLLKRKSCLKYQCRTFLALLREKRFDTIRQWIQEESGLEETVMNHIWKTFEEFNDSELILQRMCSFCKMKLKVDVSDIIDHLCSIEIITDALYNEINCSDKKIGLQNELWLKVADQCKTFPVQSYVTEALRIALTDVLEREQNDERKKVVSEIVQDLTNLSSEVYNILECKCKAICSKELQPMSLLKKISLIDVYTSPQTKRKTVAAKESETYKCRDQSNVETCTSSSTSSNESIASNLKMNNLKIVDNEAFQRESLDDRFISLQMSNRDQFIKRRSSKSKERKIKANSHKKNMFAMPCENRINSTQLTDTYGESLNNVTVNGHSSYPVSEKHDTRRSYGTEMDTTFSSDNNEHPANYRDKTREVIGKQTNAKEKRNVKMIIINPAQVNIESNKSTLLSRGRHTAIDSASD